MSTAKSIFVLAPDTPPEVVLFAASIARSASLGDVVHFVEDEPQELLDRDPSLARLRLTPSGVPGEHARIIMCGDAELVPGRASGSVWQLSIVREPAPVVRLESVGKRYSFPPVMSSSILRRFGRSVAEVPRILVAVDGNDGRRERMTARVCEELTRRRWPHRLVVVAPSASVARRLGATEGYVKPDAFELAQLISSTTLGLDTVEGDDAASTISCLAASIGVPVITHATSLLARQNSVELRTVAEWSPDAFANAVIESVPDSPSELSWGVEFEAVAEDFARVIESA